MSETAGAESPDAAFRRFLEAGEVRLQDCDDCGRQVFPPRVLCPSCGDVNLTWHEIEPRARVYSTTTVRQRPDRGGDYNVSIIELDRGARLLSRVQGIAPHEVSIGDGVTATIDTFGDQRVVTFLAQPEDDR